LGGALLHPTHWLRDTKVKVHWPPARPLTDVERKIENDETIYTHDFKIKTDDKTKKKIVYPDVKTSSGLTWRNFAFAYHNPKFMLFMMGFGLFATWLLHFSALVLNSTLVKALHGNRPGETLCKLAGLLLTTPWPLLMILGIGGALIYFTDYKPWPKRITVGVLHTLAHVLLYFTTLLVIARSVNGGWAKNDVAVVVITAVVAGIGAATVMGVYLFIMLNVFKVHWNEAFSSLRIADYDGFLRLKIDTSGKLTVYSIVIDNVPTGDQAALAPRLVEEPLELSPGI